RGEERTEVRLRHLGPGLEVAHPTGQRLSLPLGLVASLTREPRLLARGAERGHLPPELDQPLDGLAPDIRVGRVRGRLLARGPALAGALRSPRARDLLALARLDGSRVEQAVLAVDRLQTATGKQGPHGPGGGKGLGQAEIPADVRRRDLEQLTGGHPG